MGEGRRSAMVDLYVAASKLAMSRNQCVGEKNDYYVTLDQLQDLLVRQNLGEKGDSQ